VVDVIGTLEKHVERQQRENREATTYSVSVKEEDNEEELDVEELSAGCEDLVQPTNNVNGDDGNASPVLAATATAIPTSEVTGGKKRSRDAAASTRRSKKRVKRPHSTSEVAGTTVKPRVVRRSTRRTTPKAHERTIEGTSRGIEAEEADDDLMPINEEDGSPLDDGDDDHDDEDGKHGIVAKRSQQGRWAIKSFDERFNDLMDFKQKFGHCDVARKKYSEYESLGSWCITLRVSYNKIQKRETPPFKLTEENIRKLEDAGFKWSLGKFDERYAELMKFKEKFGHCNVPQKNSGKYQPLGGWCNNLRISYKKIQNRETPNHKLTEDNIRQLKVAGFKWSMSTRNTFDKRFAELMKFKEKFGHCNVPQNKPGEYKSLGNWCRDLRTAYNKIQKKETSHHNKLTQENIQQLEDEGFKWSLPTPFDKRFAELMNYKEEIGHCNVPRETGEYKSLGNWCRDVRTSYKKIQKKETSRYKLTQENIQQLEDEGFKWSLREST